jgi:hypothetical protein
VTLEALLPVAAKRQEVHSSNGIVTRSAAGLGDPTLLLKVSLLGDGSQPQATQLGVLIGNRLPLGMYRSQDELGALPPDAVPGTGAWGVLGGAYLATRVGRNWPILASIVGRASLENPLGIRSGEALEAAIDARTLLLWPVVPVLGIRGGASGPDRLRGSPVEHTGGLRLLGHAGIAWFATEKLSVGVDVLVPIYDSMAAHGLSSRLSMLAGASVMF